jgi:hypothetical protein
MFLMELRTLLLLLLLLLLLYVDCEYQVSLKYGGFGGTDKTFYIWIFTSTQCVCVCVCVFFAYFKKEGEAYEITIFSVCPIPP